MRLVLRAATSLALMGAAACAAVATSTPRPGPIAGPDDAIRIEARHVPLGIGGATLASGVSYGGGLILRGPKLHGLSDLEVQGDRAWAVSDFGDLVRFTIRLDRNGRLTSVDSAIARPLTGPDGAILTPKANADAEGLAILADGEALVSFERDHRIWSYGPEFASPASPVPHPDFAFPDNEGMEGLSADGDGWLVLGEGGGAWLCDRGGCAPLSDPMPTPADGFRFTGADRDPNGGWFVVERYYAPIISKASRQSRRRPERASTCSATTTTTSSRRPCCWRLTCGANFFRHPSA
jgi:hypothetical protein